MKHKTLLLTLAVALAFGLAGCSKNESGTTATDDANKAASSAADAAAKTAEAAKAEAAKVEAAKVAEAAKVEAAKTAEAAKVEAEKTAAAAKVETSKTDQAAQVAAATAADNTKAQGLIDKAKNLVADGKFSDATTVLQQLTGLSLTEEQKKLVDGLKDQIQKALAAKAAADAAGAAGGLLRQ